MTKSSAIQSAQMWQLFSASTVSLVSSVLLAAVLAYVQQDVINFTVIAIWFSLIVLASLLRAAFVMMYRHAPAGDDAAINSGLVRFRAFVLFSGVVWGSSGILLFPDNNPLHQMMLVIILVGLVSGAVVSFSADLICATGFTMVVLVPLMIRLLVASDGMSVGIGMALVLYIGFMTMNLRRINRNIRDNIMLRLEAAERVETLRASEAGFRSILETSPIAVRIAKAGGREVIFANKRYAELINADSSDVAGIDPKSYYTHPSDYEDILHHLEKGEQIFDRLVELTIPGYGVKWTLASYLAIQYEGEAAVLGWFYDITERTLAEEKLKLSARVFAEAHEGIIITDASGTVVDVNPTFSEITGYTRDESVGQNPRFLSSGRQSPEFYKEMWGTLSREGHWKGELWNRRKDGELYAEMLTISTLRGENSTILHYVGLFSDITHVKNQQQALELMAHYDPLTQLPNRVLFADRFHQAIARAKRDESLLGVCYLDLDGFKQVNDTFGHEVGDRLLVEVAGRIKGRLREEDTVSRMGGDEFALLMGEIHSIGECEQVLDRVHRALAQTFMINDQPVNIAASSGVVLYPLNDADPDTLLRHADQAMYQAKSEGRNRYHLFDASRDLEVQSRHQQLREIEVAFERNEFCLYYQPKVNMATGEVLGAEALIRWNHPERGLVPPMEFLPLIEATSLDIGVGNWVIDQAVQQIVAWDKQGLKLQVSVNISPHHLQWPQFVSKLEATLSFYPQIPSHRLQLEVLESSMASDLTYMSETLRACRDGLGVSIALDDFGTGYSSLTYLRHLPANIIKIDQSFVRDMVDDPNDFAIVDGVIGLAAAFRRDVIAEGVETRDHGLLLLTMGCPMAQGYGIARPMQADAMIEWVGSYRTDAKWEDYGRRPLSPTEAQLLRLLVESTQWVRRIEACVQSLPGSRLHWPIMDFDKCHCGHWMAQAKKGQAFSQALLTRLAAAQESLHQQGVCLYYLHRDGKIEEARAGMAGLTNALRLVEDILNMMA